MKKSINFIISQFSAAELFHFVLNGSKWSIITSQKTLDAAVKVLGIQVYVYDMTLNLVNNKPFRSIREASLYTKINKATSAARCTQVNHSKVIIIIVNRYNKI